jgi:hypothetical protein
MGYPNQEDFIHYCYLLLKIVYHPVSDTQVNILDSLSQLKGGLVENS